MTLPQSDAVYNKLTYLLTYLETRHWPLFVKQEPTILQNSVETSLRCGRIFSDEINTNLG